MPFGNSNLPCQRCAGWLIPHTEFGEILGPGVSLFIVHRSVVPSDWNAWNWLKKPGVIAISEDPNLMSGWEFLGSEGDLSFWRK